METRFRIPLFNVRLKLGSIKMSEASQNALLQEEQELLDKRREAIEAIEEKKAAWIKEQMASDISESKCPHGCLPTIPYGGSCKGRNGS